jgi:hypothetical protein
MRDARKSLLARSILRLGSELRLMNLSNQAAAGSTPSLTEIDTRNGFQGPDFILEGGPSSHLGAWLRDRLADVPKRERANAKRGAVRGSLSR